ncbi:vacuolar morphogenesis protein-like protein AvaB [Xylogone sp. PMI_703]|nr:vacuolar morphogenesis protein-like protein AvaB [Xylogone sp. PMI_703]
MLSAFTARPIVEFRQRDKSKIESILAFGDRILIGLNSGILRVYRVNESNDDIGKQNGSAKAGTGPSSPPLKATELLREVEKFSSKAIEQLARIKEAGILISLSNYYVSIYDEQTYTLQEQLAKTKNATTFAVTSNIVRDPVTGVPEIISKLAVAIKRRLLLWSWHDSELSPNITEITVPESIRTLTWASATKIICGLNSGYVVVDVGTQAVEDIVGLGAFGGPSGSQGSRFGAVSSGMGYMGLGGYTPKPLATKLADGEMLLARDINSLFITSEGKPIEKRQIPWQNAPESIGYSYPYILSLLPQSKGILEVRNPDTLSLLQSITLPNASQMHFPPPTVSLAHAGKGFHVVSDRCIWRMETTDYDSQIDELVEGAHYDEAISVLEMLEDALLRNKEERLREIKMQKAQILFDQRKYRDAMDIFIDVKAPPERVIKLYPKSVAGELSEYVAPEPEVKAPEEDSPTENNLNGDTPSPTNGETTQEPAQEAAASIRSAESVALEGKDLTIALLELNAFLVDTRNRMKEFIDAETGKVLPSKQNGQNGSAKYAFETLLVAPVTDEDRDREQKLKDTAKLVDTTLFRSYMLARPTLAASLFRIPNFCDPDVVNEKLLENGRYTDLIDFFHGKKLHRQALELLKKFGRDPEPTPGAEALHGPQRTVSYLQNLPPEMIDLILEFAEWTLLVNPELGMEIFVADTEKAETLPRDRVVEYLGGIDVRLEIQYLEHIINELNDMTPEFHNQLVVAYLKELDENQDRDSRFWKNLMESLLAFLRTSKQYSRAKAFGLIPREDSAFYEAQAIVLSNIGQHKQALEIYVFKMKDYEKAEEYCNRVHRSQDPSDTAKGQSHKPSTSDPEDPLPSVYHTLLSLYLTPPPPYEPNWPPALDLLSKHGSRLPASSTLSIIPDPLPVKELERYFRSRIRAANSIVNETRVAAGLRRSEALTTQANLLLGEGLASGASGRNRRVVVGEERVCGVCHKRLGGSVVAVLPDNAVVHYGCLNRSKRSGSRTYEPSVVSSWGR